jgi:Interferon-induced transmembrane protein
VSYPQPGGYGQPVPGQPKVPTYLAQAIFATVMCFMPLGIVGIVHASKVSGLLTAGEYALPRSATLAVRGRWC